MCAQSAQSGSEPSNAHFVGAIQEAHALLTRGDRERDYDSLFAALARCESISAKQPDCRDAIRLYALVAHRLGAVARARELVSERPDLLGAAERQRLENDFAARLLRWARLDPESHATRFAQADRALTILARSEDLRSRFDRIHGLVSRGRELDALAEYDALCRDGVALPVHVRLNIADAFARVERPADAKRLLLEVLSRDSDNYEARLGLVYAHCDLKEFSAATALIDALCSEQAAWVWRDGRRAAEPDYRKLDLAIAAAVVRSFAGDQGAAQQRLEELRGTAPANAYLRRELANNYLARGWHRRSQQEHRIATTLAGPDASPAIGAAWASLRLRDYRAARHEIEELERLSPERRGVQELARARTAHDSAELRVVGRLGRSDGSTFGSRDHTLTTSLYSPPILDHYRAFTRSWLAYARFPEGGENQSRAGVGIEYRAPDLEAEFEVHADTSRNQDLGVALSGRWHVDDRWSVPFGLETVSKDTPLRGQKQGVKADAAQLGLGWRQHEARRVDGTFRVMDFDDGNLRTESMLRYSQEVFDDGNTQVHGRVELYYSTNESSDVAYFSPPRDFSTELQFSSNWNLLRSPSRSFGHGLSVAAGQHWQQGFAWGTTASIEYRHYLSIGSRFDLEYRVQLARRVYDGDDEDVLAGTLSLSWRF